MLKTPRFPLWLLEAHVNAVTRFTKKKKKKRCQMTKMVISRFCYLRLLPVVKPVLLLQLLYGGKGLRQAPVQPQHHLAAVSRR